MQTSAAISRSAAAALTDGGTAKDRHALPSAVTKRFDAILHVIEIVLRDMANADPATRVALARLTEALARIVDFPPQPQESLRDFTRRLAAHMDVLPPTARALLEKQLDQQPLLAALKMLVETLRPALTLDLRIDLPLTRDGLWHPDPVSALFPDDDDQPVFRQPTIQAPLPTRMAFSQAPGVAPGAPHLQQALGQAFSPETTARAPHAPLSNAIPQTADEPVPPLREVAAFLASDAHALAQAVAIARGHAVDVLLDRSTDHPPTEVDPSGADMAAPDVETGDTGSPPKIGDDETPNARLTAVSMPEEMPELPETLVPERRSVSPDIAAALDTQPATEDQPPRAGPAASSPATSPTSDTISEAEASVLARHGIANVGSQTPTGAEAATALLQPDEAGTGEHMAPLSLRPISQTDPLTKGSVAVPAIATSGTDEARPAAQPTTPSAPQAFSGPQQTPRNTTRMLMDQTAAASSPPSAQEGEPAPKTVPALATTANRLAPQQAEGQPRPSGLRPIEETITFRGRTIVSDMPAARSQQEAGSPATSPSAGDIPDRSAVPEHNGQRARRLGASLDEDRSVNAHRSTESDARGLDRLLPKVEIALMTTGVREVANTIGQLDEWETLFYMLSGSLSETSEAPAPQEPHVSPEKQDEATVPRPSAHHGVTSDLLTGIDEDRATQAPAPQHPGEDALPVPLLPRGMEAVIARETIGYPFVPYLPVADAGSVQVEDEEPRRERRENEAGFAGGEDGESGSSSEHDEAPATEPPVEDDGERHDAYDLYQRLSDLP
ncbi:hypothetical protein G8E10_02605 [Rhizobiaceae bacterium CRRU44]|uniref:Uncharacterized protein n=1 Tax=Ferranicluibacter rubi TaxID=2715133 RepID=A0AA43ZBQ2_9HYPH|nr:hypothetical protein [Ferranicluibacter rubi]NHT74639.1 hypothetical protein [Ferranicluibacter rubi]